MSQEQVWEKESDLTDFIKAKLTEQDWKLRSEVNVDEFRVDLVGEYVSPRETTPSGATIFGPFPRTVAIEVKLEKRDVADAVSKCMRLSYLPNFDEIYVAFPKIFFGQDLKNHLSPTPVGVILAKEIEIELIPPAWHRQPPSLGIGGSWPPTVRVGDEVEFSLQASNASNVIGKAALDVEFEWKPAYPFKRPKGENNRKSFGRIDPGENASTSFKLKVASDAKPGRYPISYSVSGRRIQTVSRYQEIAVSE